ncbi:peptidylprolyl isomerase [Chloroflexia bacterium SDU3-3]|nr:peptidylprolyl isomerase [Chloroflexia bacterium SDU3-3]
MKIKHVTIVGIAALAISACGGPAASNTTATAGAAANTTAAPAASAAPATAGAGATAEAATTSGDPALVVASVGNATLTRGELDARIKRIQDAVEKQSQGAQKPTATQIEPSLVELFFDEHLTLAVAKDKSVGVEDADVENQIKKIDESMKAQGSTLEDAIQGQLGFESSTDPNFRQLVTAIVAREKISSTLVTTDTVEKEVRATVEQQGKEEIEKANVRHILVATEEEAKKVIERLDKGEKFEDLAKELSTDPGSKDNGGLYENVEKGQMVAEFDKATFEDLQPGETTKEPVKTQYGYHVMHLDSRTKGPRYTPEQIEENIKQQLEYAVYQKQQEALQKLLDEKRAALKTANQLVEPVYPTPTVAVPGELPSDLQPAEGTAEAAPEATAEATAEATVTP